jgi:hypothetical protein
MIGNSVYPQSVLMFHLILEGLQMNVGLEKILKEAVLA